jgi:hypothetical protein
LSSTGICRPSAPIRNSDKRGWGAIGSLDGTPNSPNGGTITSVGSLGLGANLNDNIGFDISGVSGIAFASITAGGISRLFTINLATGATTNLGVIGIGTVPFSSIAAAAVVPEPNTATLLLLTAGPGLSRRLRHLR